ncbi:MAG: MFS transporter [Betaproteobacteria bacterium]|nr:MAG: MFS transporter [Betaproteobacteria bacterium]
MGETSMNGQRIRRSWAAVAAVTVLNLPLGSIYAFSVFLRPIEAELGLTRSALSLVFGLATVGFSLGMLIAPYAYGLTSAAGLIAICMSAATIGIALSATTGGLTQLLIGYGVLFGLGGGAAYIVGQQCVNMLVTTRKGLVNGYIVGLWPAGAMLAAPLFGWANAAFGFRWTMGGLALALLLSGLAGIVLLNLSGAILPRQVAGGASGDRRFAIFARLFTVFFVAAAAGLTVLSQAAGMIAAYGGTTGMALAATTAIAGGIAVARVSGGWLTDRYQVPYVGAFAQGFALTGAILLTLWPNPLVAAVALGMVGMGYGFISGCTAGAIAQYWPPADYGWIASRIYVAWCVAAISLPILAGHLFDLTRGYETAVIIAGCGNLVGVIVALGLPRRALRDA